MANVSLPIVLLAAVLLVGPGLAIDDKRGGVNRKLEKLQKELTSLIESNNAEIGALNNKTEAELQALEQSNTAKIEALNNQFEAELQALEQSNNYTINAEIEALEQSNKATIKAEIEALEQSNNAKIEALNSKYEAELQALEQSNNAKIKAEIEALEQSNNATIKAEIEALDQSNNAKIENEVDALKAINSAEIDAEIEELNKSTNAKVDALDADVQSLQTKLEDLNDRFPEGPCLGGEYSEVKDDWRDMNNTARGYKCDRDLLSAGWHRFYLKGRPAVIPTNWVKSHSCNTHASWWVDMSGKELPAMNKEVSTRGCASFRGKICAWHKPITLRNCGHFFIYKFQPSTGCANAYCVMSPQ